MSKHLDFTYTSYLSFLKYAKTIAPVIPLKEYNYQENKNCIILRHDVDIDIYPAYKLAKIENKIGVKSTYFILTTSHTYNPQSPLNRTRLLEMCNGGFEIGLHFDPTVYGDISHDKMLSKVRTECNILEDIIGEPIRSISLHNPSIHGMFPSFDGYFNAYSPNIFSDSVYMSDSCMNFREKDPDEFIKKATEMPIQLLFHPFQWSEVSNSYKDLFKEYLFNLSNYIDEYFKTNNYQYRNTLKNEKLWDALFEKGIK